ncbi:hypothetical protein BD779DRAFT_291646 [Infundibulicybe gibba]|nr:hypothetical protein BD779DRAFT_291646 [Infundibulicybe gibba]
MTTNSFPTSTRWQLSDLRRLPKDDQSPAPTTSPSHAPWARVILLPTAQNSWYHGAPRRTGLVVRVLYPYRFFVVARMSYGRSYIYGRSREVSYILACSFFLHVLVTASAININAIVDQMSLIQGQLECPHHCRDEQAGVNWLKYSYMIIATPHIGIQGQIVTALAACSAIFTFAHNAPLDSLGKTASKS